MKEIPVYNGQKINRLTISSWFRKRTGVTSLKIRIFCRCLCDCGKKTIVEKNNLINNHTKSCGCLNEENMTNGNNRKHGKRHSRTYRIWCNMIQRCTNPNNKSYKHYGGRGITCDESWMASFENFIKDIGEIPDGLTIERKNNNLGYFKNNIVFATQKQQCNNKRNNRMITWRGKTKSFSLWADELGKNQSTLRNRIFILRWSINDAFTKPVRIQNRFQRTKSKKLNNKQTATNLSEQHSI